MRCFAAAYAARQDAAPPAALGPLLTPAQAGQAITGLVIGDGHDQDAYLLTAAGLSPVS